MISIVKDSRRLQAIARALTVALLLAVTLTAVTTHTAFAYIGANPGSCSALTPSGSYTSGFGSTLGSWYDGTHTIVSCSNGNTSYESKVYNSYGMVFQCQELIQRYVNDHWGDSPFWGASNAGYNWTIHPSRFTAYRNASTYEPHVGDIMVWGPMSNGNPAPNNNTAGHVAIISSIVYNSGSYTVYTFEQNYYYQGMVSGHWETMTRYTYNGSYYWTISSNYHIIDGGTSQLYGVLHA